MRFLLFLAAVAAAIGIYFYYHQPQESAGPQRQAGSSEGAGANGEATGGSPGATPESPAVQFLALSGAGKGKLLAPLGFKPVDPKLMQSLQQARGTLNGENAMVRKSAERLCKVYQEAYAARIAAEKQLESVNSRSVSSIGSNVSKETAEKQKFFADGVKVRWAQAAAAFSQEIALIEADIRKASQ